MEKKNTMLLTVIAVATLLVAVVGATFAYFSLQTGDGGTTTANVSAGEVGSVVFSGATQTLKLSVTAEDMAQPENDTYYFAVKEETQAQLSGGKWVSNTSATAPEGGSHTVATVKLTGGATTDEYTCENNSLSVTATGGMITALEGHEGWAKLVISGTMNASETIDLSELESGQAHSVTVPNITFDGQGTGKESDSKDIKAELYLLNSKTDSTQSAIAGTSVDVTITFTPGVCSVAKKAS